MAHEGSFRKSSFLRTLVPRRPEHCPGTAFMSAAVQPISAAESSEYVRVKRKRQTIFLYANMPIDTVHDLRARANLVTKVPTSEMRFFLDESGEVLLDENKTLKEQKVSSTGRKHRVRLVRLVLLVLLNCRPAVPTSSGCQMHLHRLRTTWCCTWSTGFRVRAVYARARRPETTPRSLAAPDLPFCIPTARASLTSLAGSEEWETVMIGDKKAEGEA